MRVERWWLGAAAGFALAGGAAGLLLRGELARPGLQIVGAGGANTALSLHGTVSLLLVAVPLAIGLATAVLRPGGAPGDAEDNAEDDAEDDAPGRAGHAAGDAANDAPGRAGHAAGDAANDAPGRAGHAPGRAGHAPGDAANDAPGRAGFRRRAAAAAPVVFVVGGLLVLAGYLWSSPAEFGWFAYAPLESPPFAPEPAAGRAVSVIGTTLVVVAVVAGVLPLIAAARARTGSPFAAAVAAAGAGTLVVLPVVALRLVRLAQGPDLGFLRAVGGGEDAAVPLIRAPEPLTGVVGTPDVLLLVLPFLGLIGEVLARAARRPLAGERVWRPATGVVAGLAVVAAYWSWIWPPRPQAHPPSPHAGLWLWLLSTAGGVAVAVLVACWLVTLVRGTRGRPSGAVLFAGGAVLSMVVGALSGLWLAIPGGLLDGSTFVAAHQHEAFYGPLLFGGFAGLYRWWPRITGRRLPDGPGRWHAGLALLGWQLMLLPQFVLGAGGMPRRYADYLPEDGFSSGQLLSGVGAAVLAASVVPFVLAVVRARRC